MSRLVFRTLFPALTFLSVVPKHFTTIWSCCGFTVLTSLVEFIYHKIIYLQVENKLCKIYLPEILMIWFIMIRILSTHTMLHVAKTSYTSLAKVKLSKVFFSYFFCEYMYKYYTIHKNTRTNPNKHCYAFIVKLIHSLSSTRFWYSNHRYSYCHYATFKQRDRSRIC